MFTKFRLSKPFMLFCLVSALALFTLFTSPIITAKASQADAPIKDVKSLLDDYSLYLNTGATSHKTAYSPVMASLIQERQSFYAEYYKTGLHLNLNSLESSFLVDDSTTSRTSDGATHTTVLEIVTMYGYPIITKAEDYPLISAAKWAITKTDDKTVQEELKQYIDATINGANESISNGVKITFRVNHNIDIASKNGSLQIIHDEFTDKESDNGDGFDNVTWAGGNPIRLRPDFTSMLEYSIYNSPVEVLGQHLLDDYTRAYGGGVLHNVTPAFTGNFSYNRTAARDYALSYVVQTGQTCAPNVYRDSSVYNPLYQEIWTNNFCSDCTDFVSQALEAGGFKPDSIWNNQGTGTDTWNVFGLTTLAYYLKTTKQAIDVYNYATSLYIGDLVYGGTPTHLVIVTGIVPVRYSGHTSDRFDYPLSNVSTILTNFWHIRNTFPETYTFVDVPPTHSDWQYIERLYSSGITSGCSINPKNYCPGSTLTRAEMAVFILRGKYTSSYIPPAYEGIFGDVPENYWAATWVEQLFREGITVGCGGGNYCPDQPISNAEMAVFLLRARHYAAYQPPAPTGIFEDVPPSHWAAAFIEGLFNDGIGFECGPAIYCPGNAVTRAKMAVLMVRTFNVP